MGCVLEQAIAVLLSRRQESQPSVLDQKMKLLKQIAETKTLIRAERKNLREIAEEEAEYSDAEVPDDTSLKLMQQVLSELQTELRNLG